MEKQYIRYIHDTNKRFTEGKKYKIIKDYPELKYFLVEIENDSYRNCDLIYYYQGYKTE